METEKGYQYDGNLLNKDSDGFETLTNQIASKKVTNKVGTFLNTDSNGFKISITQMASEKVTGMVGTFLNKDGVGSFFKVRLTIILNRWFRSS